MAKLSRVCPHCGTQGPLDSAYCGQCGQSATEHAIPQPDAQPASLHENNFPIQLRKAAFPIIAGAAGLMVRVGWKLLQSKVARDVALNAANSVVQSRLQPTVRQPTVRQTTAPEQGHAQNQDITRKNGRTIRISSRWAVGDARGILRQGQSEHTIEIDD